MKILIVDDEPRSALLLKAHLEQLLPPCSAIGFEISLTGLANKLSTIAPDLIFFDIWVSGMSVFDLLEKPEMPKIPFVLCSASKEYAFQAFEAGANGYLLKPVNTHDLRTALERVLSMHPHIQPA